MAARVAKYLSGSEGVAGLFGLFDQLYAHELGLVRAGLSSELDCGQHRRKVFGVQALSPQVRIVAQAGRDSMLPRFSHHAGVDERERRVGVSVEHTRDDARLAGFTQLPSGVVVLFGVRYGLSPLTGGATGRSRMAARAAQARMLCVRAGSPRRFQWKIT